MKAVKIGIVVCCALAAGLIVLFGWGPSEPEPDTLDFVRNMKCAACGVDYELTGVEYHKEFERANVAEPFFCKECSEQQAYHAIQCLTCQTWFIPQEVEGSTGRCPQCGPELFDSPEDEAPRERPRARSM